jgi:hypothetical protein
MTLEERKNLLVQLGSYMQGNDEEWQAVKQRAFSENHWFIPEFIDLATKNIAEAYLSAAALDQLIVRYGLPFQQAAPKKVGIVMAGNIPLVGFHDFLCVFLSGHIAMIKPSSKDEVLIKHLVKKLAEWELSSQQFVVVSEMIRNCDAYIATGSNNSSRYFEYYFQKYPSIIRRNRTSVAILTGKENREELEKLADDVYQFFGLGCRNVTKIFVPEGYDFLPLLEAFRKYDFLANHHKYKNNYDYNLAVHILNNKYYMTNGSILLVENESPFSPISQLHYQFYSDENEVRKGLHQNMDIQCLVSAGDTSFGGAQTPGICDYADGVDTMEFLKKRV